MKFLIPEERHSIIIEKLQQTGKVELEELLDNIGVSAMTIRRDLAFLEKEGKLIRTHGGAVLPDPIIAETPYMWKESKNIEYKREIATKAIPLIKPGSSLFLDSGTTTLEIAKQIKEIEGLTIITNDIRIAFELLEAKSKVMVTGGELQSEVGALFGPPAQEFLQGVHVDLFFLGAHAVEEQAGVTAPTYEKAAIKKAMLASAQQTWLVADSSKFQHKSFAEVCGITDLAGMIVDEGIMPETRNRYSNMVEVI
ncbi:DeoR/GlpR family DNA-binding transcription regulator [Rossellomorea marisflavi]|uniref:DeoR/GlpR family DNA-binding transcription regulator n=1 Tax=Rossellomorea marisflavi TaxID=189381 RepID=UPI003458CDBC